MRGNHILYTALPANEIIRLYTINKTPYNEIAKMYHCYGGTIRKVLALNGIRINNSSHRKTFTNLETNGIIMLYSIHKISSVEIGKLFNVSFSKILDVLRENNVPILDTKNGAKSYLKSYITEKDLPDIIKHLRHDKNKHCTGEVTCPICHKTRRLSLNRTRIIEITRQNGRCAICASKKRAYKLNEAIIIRQYCNDKTPIKHIASKLNISGHVIEGILRKNNIKFRQKGYSHILEIHNKGTAENPIIGDICRGTDIGLKDKSYYVRVSCQNCNSERWQSKNRVKKSPLCRECSLKLMGENHQGENAVNWHGGLSFIPYPPTFNFTLRRKIRERDNYICQLCGKQENGIKLAVHHIDYNKHNNHHSNLISLCTARKGHHANNTSCHSKTNGNREYWTKYFTELIKNRGLQ